MKSFLLTFTGLLACICAEAQVVGPLAGNAFSNNTIPGSSQSWTGAGNVNASDDNYASFGNILLNGGYTDYLQVTDFGFNLPAGIVINGIKVDVECSDPNLRTSDYSVRIVKQNVIGASERALGTAYQATDKPISYGGSTDLWGEAWTFKHINDNGFGIAISAKRNALGSTTAGRIDNITITVYYSLITLPVTISSFSAAKENKSVVLNWTAATETGMTEYDVQRSSNGVNFYTLTAMPSLNQNASDYSYTDQSPLPGVNYYRLKMQGIAGYEKYSQVATVHFSKQASISLTPCPWTKGNELFISNPNKETLRIQFYNANGQMISTAITASDKVGTENLSNKEGKFYYNVFNARNELLGSGTLIIQ